MVQTFLLELNEINFDYVRDYVAIGKLPNLGALLSNGSISETTSEDSYEELEPWIQWVTAHTGKSLAEHGVFRLGDIVNFEYSQIWEHLEAKGVTVGAVSPINAKNRTGNACFFVPDPWTKTKVTGSKLSQYVHNAIAQAVNDNAKSRISLSSAFWLVIGAFRYARLANLLQYLRLVLSAKAKPWAKAIFLDLLLADMFIKLTRSRQPGFASLFLNAGAHIQHHYLFSSQVYRGALKNPEWYIEPGIDPVLELYEVYDRIVAQVIAAFPDSRVLIATGLHQDPHPQLTYYWRLRDHADFLKKHAVPFSSVEPRMSRDFLIRNTDANEARLAEALLNSAVDSGGLPLFDVDNRGSDLFVMLTYPHDIPKDFEYVVGNQRVTGLRDDVAFVAIKNGQHNGIGYFIDTGANPGEHPVQFPLADLHSKVESVVLG